LSQFHCRVRLRDTASSPEKTIFVDGVTMDEVVQKLIAQNYLVLSVTKAGGKAERFRNIFSFEVGGGSKGKSKGSFLPFLQHVSTRELIFFAIQLGTLLRAGIPLLRSLEIIRNGASNAFFQTILKDLQKKVSEGGTLSHALREYSNIFPWIWVNLVEVGEATGKLPDCLEEVAHYQESASRIKSKVITAFFYPAVLSCAVVGALTFLLVYIVPKFAAIFTAQKMTLPAITQVVMAVSDLVRNQFPLLMVFVVAFVTGLFYIRKSPKLRISYDLFRLSFPVFGPLVLQVATVRFAKSLSTLLRSGVQILQALEITGRLVENRFLEVRITETAHAVKGGQGLGAQLEAKKVFPVFMTQLVTIGEESGQIEKFLDLIANFYEEQVDTFLQRLTTLLEPVLLVFMGAVIGVVVVSMFLPIIELTTKGGAM